MNQKAFQQGKTAVYILICLSMLFLGAFGFWFYQEMLKPKITEPSVVLEEPAAEEPLVAEAEDDSETETEETKSDLELIKEAFSQKYDKPTEETNVTINENTGLYAQGGVSFTGEISGAWWLAYKEDDGWIIVADGNGTIPCEAIEPYDFPTDMVPECYNESDGTLVVRS